MNTFLSAITLCSKKMLCSNRTGRFTYKPYVCNGGMCLCIYLVFSKMKIKIQFYSYITVYYTNNAHVFRIERVYVYSSQNSSTALNFCKEKNTLLSIFLSSKFFPFLNLKTQAINRQKLTRCLDIKNVFFFLKKKKHLENLKR